MNKAPVLLALAALAVGCHSAPAKKAPLDAVNSLPARAPTPAYNEPVLDYSRRITLTGDLLAAPQLKIMALALVPFGRDANAIGMDKQQGGVQFQVQLESCSENGCIVESGDVNRIIVARSGIADAFPLGFIDPAWRRQGLSAISDKGWLAMPVAMADNSRELWIIDQRFRIRKRIPHKITNPCLLRWRGEELFLVAQGKDSTMESRRVNIDTGRIISASPIEPWWPDCQGQTSSPYSAGWDSESPRGFEGRLVLPLWRRGDAQPIGLELGEIVRPMTGNGLASPQKVAVDCEGRFCIVTAMGADIWCMRFTPDGKLESAGHVSGNIAGDAKGIQIDRRGRFYFLETILASESPEKIHLIRLE